MGRSGPKGPREVLTERDRIFIKAYLTGGSKTAAAIAAGASEKKARSAGYQMAKKPVVAKAIAAAQTEVQKENAFDLKAAIVELDQRIAAADKAKQHSAVAKMLELKMKAHGLLVEKFDVRQSGFSVEIIGVGQDKPPTIHLNGSGLPALPAPAFAKKDEDEGAGLID
jgi:phage terminase small subunit